VRGPRGGKPGAAEASTAKLGAGRVAGRADGDLAGARRLRGDGAADVGGRRGDRDLASLVHRVGRDGGSALGRGLADDVDVDRATGRAAVAGGDPGARGAFLWPAHREVAPDGDLDRPAGLLAAAGEDLAVAQHDEVSADGDPDRAGLVRGAGAGDLSPRGERQVSSDCEDAVGLPVGVERGAVQALDRLGLRDRHVPTRKETVTEQQRDTVERNADEDPPAPMLLQSRHDRKQFLRKSRAPGIGRWWGRLWSKRVDGRQWPPGASGTGLKSA